MSSKTIVALTLILLLSFTGILGAPGPFLWWGHSGSTYNRPRPPLVGAHAHGHGPMHPIHHMHQHAPVVRPLQPGGHVHRVPGRPHGHVHGHIHGHIPLV